MSLRFMVRPLCRLLGHARIIETDERANKSEYVCERCGAVLGDFVTNLRKYGSEPIQGRRPPDLNGSRPGTGG
jgi:hypothetical protein